MSLYVQIVLIVWGLLIVQLFNGCFQLKIPFINNGTELDFRSVWLSQIDFRRI